MDDDASAAEAGAEKVLKLFHTHVVNCEDSSAVRKKGIISSTV